ncbi:MAG: DEAD/DEAH box helicase [Candidatus ainarchaeum sp.]|nr:DEAD/DEAH box helicase [Candidatus ainarchaeum sp.]
MNNKTIPEFVLEQNKFKEFNPVQKKCLELGFESNLIVSSPTASGKTIIAELFMLENVFNKKQKVIYTCPLRALASEHYTDFKKKYPDIKFALSTGDIDSNSSYLKKFDVILTTYEKLVSLIRHKAEWLENVGCLIIDEIHELDSDRGPTLEIAITQLRNQKKDLIVLGLSATISNAKELSDWMDANLIQSDFRPTQLIEGIYSDNIIEYNNKELIETNLEKLVEKNISTKQFLFFLNSRKRAEGQAKKISKELSNLNINKIELNKISNIALNVLEQPTQQCHDLAECLKNGIAFHHAGLLSKQKEIVETNFRKGLIKVICSTTTLSAGINTPADFVIIPSMYRYGQRGMELIPIREYKQCAGRSGRPKFSLEGRSIIIANNENQKELFAQKYINGISEPICSKLGSESVLRTHVLGLIATNEIFDDKSCWDFFKKTLFVKQNNSALEIFDNIFDIIQELIEMNFVEKKNSYFSCTKIGKRVSDLFLDPKSAFILINSLKNKKNFSELSYLFTWANCFEFNPKITVPKKIQSNILEEFNSRINELPFKKEDLFFDNDSLNTFFSALLLEKWINEFSEQELFEDFGMAPGTLFGKNRIIEWLSYSTIELSKVLELNQHIISSKKIGLRAKYGIREELLQLVELKGIGRVRARKLFNNKIKTINDVKNNLPKIERVLGKTIAENLKKQLKII